MVAVADDKIARVIVPGEAVDVPAQVLDLPLDELLRPFIGSGKNEVFKKMGEPAFRLILTCVSGTDKNESSNHLCGCFLNEPNIETVLKGRHP